MTAADGAIPCPAAAHELSIIHRVIAGEKDAFELLMRRYNRRLYRLARAVLRNDEEAEDALQEAYLSAYRLLAQYRAEAALSTWLSRLVLNECLGRLRRTARRNNVIAISPPPTGFVMDANAVDDSDLPDKILGRAQMRELLQRKLDELPEIFRVVFVLRSVEELGIDETAECLNIPEATVRSRHFRAKALLREALAQDLDLAERDLYDFGGTRCDRVTAGVLAKLRS
jgi:RNA polymerase sigma-70 factor (ECF subfamily)